MLLGGRYKLLRLAGRGGTGEIWRAQVVGAEGFTRPVAVKRVYAPILEANELRALFIEEARVCSRLDHPNVVQVFDFGEDDAGLYLVMEWVEGMSLRELVDTLDAHGHRPSAPIIAAIGIEVLRALEAAHTHAVRRADGSVRESPIIHRDVTPANVLVSVRGAVKLADFGFARAFDRSRMTPLGIVKGKVRYLSPEQVRGEEASVRSDLYACGTMLWEILAGQRIFPDKSDRTIARALLAGVRHAPIRSINPSLPEPIAVAVDRAMSFDAADRFGSANEFATALCDALRKIPERTDPVRIAAIVNEAVALREAAEARENAATK